MMHLYCAFLRFSLRYLEVASLIASVGGNHRYIQQLSREWHQLKGQLDQIEVRYSISKD